MEMFLLQLMAFLRPIFFIKFDFAVGGIEPFELAAVALTGLLLLAFAINTSVRKTVRWSAVDSFMATFCVWCLAIYAIYPEKTLLRETAKLILPFVTYIVAKNVLRDWTDYRRVLLLLIAGFAVPVVASAVLIASGGGVEYVSYWTRLPRYEGAYAGAHNMSHNMAFLIIVATLYVTSAYTRGDRIPVAQQALLAVLVVLAVYGLYQGRVRTAILGLGIFFALYLWFFNRRVLLAVVTLLLPLCVWKAEEIAGTLFYDASKVMAGEWDPTRLASSRPRLWMNNLRGYADLPLDRQIAGVGIGNKLDNLADRREHLDLDGFRDSHNDYLEMLIQTGAVGFFLFCAVQFCLFRAIRRLPAQERALYFAFFAAVTIMNLASNSYVTRFGLAQMLYLVLAYVELPRRGAPVGAATGTDSRRVHAGAEHPAAHPFGTHAVLRRTQEGR